MSATVILIVWVFQQRAVTYTKHHGHVDDCVTRPVSGKCRQTVQIEEQYAVW